ncbi:MAG: long-chain fatty acid--CoA ligase [Deltaproteobacteria bacterium CG23_combo_of_CG06-09_8_20_14_all_51_20]|nr:long-chain fatty acid--CoA ligase [bacterium]OIP43290.1 MAG: long-chain fatty acid--CoA ligase [Desulfobacteraceae bacterium CG2_30_51_40]PIP48682.1 MAG: long-chain fatty acid--CoA ligase [Deltaproteobacteria bacterium CG23_combo_of_CG06-09_8_20_14_all_51_20]PIY26091.1 MAG: long-chain fatty acid--CoA ligase [Deltaproteobacteria bacterium CG_4_10_14_3_um_filter_51_14]PJB34555.1 MAG: long-chain fatty acid--CoA ligase [Deltaproteobacteria bacterium CG_4_9_14_3_um_filter_51_14]
MDDYKSLPAILKANAEHYGDSRVAIREKEFGIWQSVTWKGYYENVKSFALGLYDMGFRRGHKLCYMGDNRPEGLYSELAAQSLGGAIVGVYPDSHLEQVEYIINHSDSSFVVAGDQEQADKALAIKEKVPNVTKIIVDDPKGMRHYNDPILAYFRDIQERGRRFDEKEPGFFERILDAVTLEDVGMINYTSGTTGLPKGSMITHRNMISVARAQDFVDNASPDFEYVSFLPLPWIGEQEFGVYWAVCSAFTVNFPEKVETVQENIREIGPHIMLAPPRIWERICSEVLVKIKDAAWIKRKAYKFFLPLGYKVAEIRFKSQQPSLLLKLAIRAAYWSLFRPLKNYFGLTRLKHVYTGGAPLGPEIFKLFQALGVNIKQAYGMTEQTAASVIHRLGDIRLDTVGIPLPGLEFRVSDTGELLSRGDTIFKGYYNNPKATEAALEGGWFHSGDAAVIDDDGHIIIIDRMSDVMKLADGSKFSPQLIENKLKFSPYIMDAVVIGQNRPFIAAMIAIDMANVGKWAEENKLPYTTFADLSQKDEVYDLIAGEVAVTNESLPKVAKVRRFVLLYKQLDPDDDELTRTRKVRRKFVEERYKDLIVALYGDKGKLEVVADIRYTDGKEFKMKTSVTIMEVSQEKQGS